MENVLILMNIPIDLVSKMSRVTEGVRLINLKDNHKVSTVSSSKQSEAEEEEKETE